MFYNGQRVTEKVLPKSFVMTWSDTWLTVWNEASKINLPKSLTKIQCPVYFCIGRKDYQTNANITEDYYRNLNAPAQQLFWFEQAGHAIPSSSPQQLQNVIIKKILPGTYTDAK